MGLGFTGDPINPETGWLCFKTFVPSIIITKRNRRILDGAGIRNAQPDTWRQLKSTFLPSHSVNWVTVMELMLSYHSKETLWFTT